MTRKVTLLYGTNLIGIPMYITYIVTETQHKHGTTIKSKHYIHY